MDQEVLNHMKQRDTLKRNKLWRAYKQERNLTNNLIKRKKKAHIANLVDKNHGRQTRHLWETLRNHHTKDLITPITLSTHNKQTWMLPML